MNQAGVGTPRTATEAHTVRTRRRRPPTRLEVFLIRLIPMLFACFVVYKQYHIYFSGRLSWIYYHGYFFTVLFLIFTALWVYRLRLRKRFLASAFWVLVYNCIPPALFLLLVFAQRQPIAAVYLFDFTIIIFALLRFSTVSENEDRRKRNRHLNRAHRATACLFLCLMVIPSAIAVFKYHMLSSEEEFSIRIANIQGGAMLDKITAVNDKNVIYAKYKSLYQDLRNWNDLDTEARTGALAELVALECAVHGIHCDATVSVRKTEQGTLGYYDHQKREICISASLIHDADPERILTVVLHEYYHLYQHSICDLIREFGGWDSRLAAARIFDEARVWQANFDLYLRSENVGFEAYELQPVEISARAYAQEELENIQQLIENAA